MNKPALWVFGVVFSLVNGTQCYAAAGDGEAMHSVSVAGGIVAPSVMSSVYENPAALSHTRGAKISLNGNTSDSSFTTIGAGATLNLSTNGVLGFGLGVQHGMLRSDTSVSSTYGHLGAGYFISELQTAIGISGSRQIRSSVNSAAGSWHSNLGLSLFPRSQVTLALMAYDVFGTIDAYGAGIKIGLSQGARFVLDATTNTSFKGLRLLPALAVQSGMLSLNYGYGIEVDDTASGTQLPLEHVVGLGLLGRSISLQLYYNHFDLYMANLTFRL